MRAVDRARAVGVEDEVGRPVLQIQLVRHALSRPKSPARRFDHQPGRVLAVMEQHRRLGMAEQVLALAALVVGVEDETGRIEAFQQRRQPDFVKTG